MKHKALNNRGNNFRRSILFVCCFDLGFGCPYSQLALQTLIIVECICGPTMMTASPLFIFMKRKALNNGGNNSEGCVCLYSTVMHSRGPAFQKSTRPCNENAPAPKEVWSIWDVNSLPDWYTINSPTTLHNTQWNPVTHYCLPMLLFTAGCILQAKLTSLNNLPSPGSPWVTVLSASSVQTLVHCVMKDSRPPDLKSSSNVRL